jgi:hypothetical protein
VGHERSYELEIWLNPKGRDVFAHPVVVPPIDLRQSQEISDRVECPSWLILGRASRSCLSVDVRFDLKAT